MSLTHPQIATLKALPFSYTVWGGRRQTSLPEGANDASLNALVSRGLVARVGKGFERHCSITPAGRAALAEKAGA